MTKIVKYDSAREKLYVCFSDDLVWEYLRIKPNTYQEIKKLLTEEKSIMHLLNSCKFTGKLKEVNNETE